MRRRLPIFYSALLLTGVNLLLRMVGASFQVYLSGHIGASGIGLLQLTVSVTSLAMVAGMAGIRTGTMYLTARALGAQRPREVPWVLSACFRYSLCFSLAVGAALWTLAPFIASHWLGDTRTELTLRVYAAFLPCICLCGVMTGYFTGANRIGTLTAVEVAEQLFTMAFTFGALQLWARSDTGRACTAVVLGSCLGSVLTLVTLCFLRLQDRQAPSPPVQIGPALAHTALPLALADVVKAGITTTENLMVPIRLAKCTAIAEPLAAFGVVSGMVFPVMMFPACILFGLAELLIPELARCAAGGRYTRSAYLVRRGLWVAVLYGTACACLLYLCSESLGTRLYDSSEVGTALRRYAVLVPMLYCDAITDAMTKGLGQQNMCVRYNILTSALDVALLYFLLPRYGMDGYFISFLVSHAVNFILSLRRLLIVSGQRLSPRTPLLTLGAGIAAVWLAGHLGGTFLRVTAFAAAFGSLLVLTGVVSRAEIRWVKGLLFPAKRVEFTAN